MIKKRWSKDSDWSFRVEYWAGTIIVGLPPKLPHVRQMIDELDNDEVKQARLIFDLLILWYLINARSNGKRYSAPEPFSGWGEYYSLSKQYPEAAKCMWDSIREKWAEQKREREARIPESVRKLRKIKNISSDYLEYIHSIRDADFFQEEQWIINIALGYIKAEDREYICTELQTLWYIIKHIGPRRRIKATIDVNSVDYLIYTRLRRQWKSEHDQMVEFIQSHPELSPPIQESDK